MGELSVRLLVRCLATMMFAGPTAGAQDPNVTPPPVQSPPLVVTPGQHGVQTAAEVLGRVISITVTDVPLGEALRAIAAQAGVRVLFSDRVVPSDRRISVALTDVTVAHALAVVLNGTDIVSRADGDQITLSRRRPEDAPTAQGVALVHGRVTDSTTSKPIAGAFVNVQGLSLRATTNDSGFYTIFKVPGGRQALMVRALGYHATERVITAPDSEGIRVDFRLSLTMTRLAEIVTTATGPQRRLELGNDISVLDVDSIVKGTPVTNLPDVLTARVPGLIVMPTSGNPGDPVRLRLRGINSIQLNSDPIIIVDGIRLYAAQSDPRNRNTAASSGYFAHSSGVPGTTVNLTGISPDGSASDPSLLDQIDVNSIESLEVVKGPSAATLYGPDAAAGVIVIRTKHGVNGPPRWSVDASDQVTFVPGKYPEQALAFGHPYNNNATTICPNNPALGAGTPCVVDSIARFQLLNDRHTTLLRMGQARTAGLGVSGGSTTTMYNVQATVRDNTDMVKLPDVLRSDYEQVHGGAPPGWMEHPGDYSQYSVESGLRMSIGSHFDVSLTGLVANNGQNRSTLQEQIPSYMQTYIDRRTHILYTEAGGGLFPDASLLNGVYTQETEVTTSFTSGANLEWRPFTWLTNVATIGLNSISVDEKAFLANGLDPLDSAGGYAASAKSTLQRTVSVRSGLTHIKLVADFYTTLTVGVDYNSTQTHDFTATTTNGVAQGVSSLAGAQQISTSEDRAGPATYGMYVTDALSWGDRLYLDAGLRLDGGNTYGTRSQLPRFPKVGASYIISQERFFPAVLHRFIDLLQLRGAYGESEQQPPFGQRYRLYNLGSTFLDSALVPTATLSTIGNTKLRPERGAETEAGFASDLFGNRISVSFNWNRTMRFDALVDVPIPPSVSPGNTFAQTRNVGTIRNSGITLTVSALLFETPIIAVGGDFSLYHNSEKVLSLAHGVREIDEANNQIIAPGYPLFGIWARPIIGYADRNHDGIIEPSEVQVGDSAVFMGASLPNYETAWHVNLSLLRRSVTVTAGFHYQNGLTQTNLANAYGQMFLPGVNNPHASLGEQAAVAALPQTLYGVIQTVNTLRFDNLSVRFALPQWVVRRFGAGAGDLALEGTDLGLWTNYHGKDPDVNTFTYGNSVSDFGQIPTPRTYGVRLQLTY